MLCPSCNNTLSPKEAAGIAAQVCAGGCGESPQIKLADGTRPRTIVPPAEQQPLSSPHGGCGGLWLEGRRVRKIRDRLPGAGADLLNVPRAEGVHLFRDVEHPCPHCRTTLLYRHCFDRDLELEIDQCAKCAGFWLETGPLNEIVNLDRTLKDRTQKAERFFHVLMNEKVATMNFVNHDTLEAAQQIVLIFRFLTPPDLFPNASILGNLFR